MLLRSFDVLAKLPRAVDVGRIALDQIERLGCHTLVDEERAVRSFWANPPCSFSSFDKRPDLNRPIVHYESCIALPNCHARYVSGGRNEVIQ